MGEQIGSKYIAYMFKIFKKVNCLMFPYTVLNYASETECYQFRKQEESERLRMYLPGTQGGDGVVDIIRK